MRTDPEEFVRRNTTVLAPPLVPEIRLHLASEIAPIWQATEADLETAGLPPPFWAFCWPGGQALARYVLDRPETVRGRRVLDFACGGAVSGIAAAMAGAAAVSVNDVDGHALTAAQLNSALNGVELEMLPEVLTHAERPPDFEVILAGDIFYEQAPATGIEAFLRRAAAAGAVVLIGDPGRKYLPTAGLEERARYPVPVSLELEDREIRDGIVWQVVA